MNIKLKDIRYIGISGAAGAGKSSVAEYFQYRLNLMSSLPVDIMPLSAPIKAACKEIFCWTENQLSDNSLKEIVDTRFGISPRRAMQLLGTEFGRDMVCDDLWTRLLDLKISGLIECYNAGVNDDFNVIIPDIRFSNEVAWLRSKPSNIVIKVVSDTSTNVPQHSSEQLSESDLSADVLVFNDKSLGIEALHKKLNNLFFAS
jgi:hypothetical protein